MFVEKFAAWLQSLLGNYVDGISKEAVSISVWNGDLKLTNLKLKPDAFTGLNLPFCVSSGFIGSISVKFPWSQIRNSPVTVELQTIFILLTQKVCKASEEFDDLQSIRSSELKRAEMEALSTNQSPASAKAWSSWLSALMGTIVGNLKISVCDVHVRFEDGQSGKESMALGLTLERLAAFTLNEGQRLVADKAVKRVEKAVELKSLALYLDAGRTVAGPEERAEDDHRIAFEHFKACLEKGDVYILCPVNATATYFHQISGGNESDLETPTQSVAFNFQDVSVNISVGQYREIMRLVEYFSAFKRRLEAADLRPRRPVLQSARRWWVYAVKATARKLGLGAHSVSWQNVVKLSSLRRRYIQAYVRHLRQPEVEDYEAEVLDMDSGLRLELSLQWRLAARAFVKRQGAEGPQASMWNRVNAKQPTPLPPNESFTAEDWKQLNDMVGYKSGMEAAFLPSRAQNNASLHTRLSLRMQRSATRLLGDDGAPVLLAEMMSFSCSAKVYQKTVAVDVTFGDYRVSGAHSVAMENVRQQGEESISVSFMYLPQHMDVDWWLDARASACLITFDKKTVEELLSFFQGSEAVSASVALDTTVAFQFAVEEVRKVAQRQLEENLRGRTRFALKIDIDAPKLRAGSKCAVEGVNETHLLLDFGRFCLQSLPEGSGSSKEGDGGEGMYMQFSMCVESLSAFLVDGPVDWNLVQSINAASQKPGLPDALGSSINGMQQRIFRVVEPCGFSAFVEQIWGFHPLYPTMRIGFRLQSLKFHFSVGVYHRLMAVIGEIQSSAQKPTVAPWDDALKLASISVLSWADMRSVVWVEGCAALAGPYVYILSSPLARRCKTCISLRNKHVLRVPKGAMEGGEFVLAVTSGSRLSTQNLLATRDTHFLRFKSEGELHSWEHLLQWTATRFYSNAASQLQSEEREFQAKAGKLVSVFGVLNDFSMTVSGLKEDGTARSRLLREELLLLRLKASTCLVDLTVLNDLETAVEFSVQSIDVEDVPTSQATQARSFLLQSHLTSLGLSAAAFSSVRKADGSGVNEGEDRQLIGSELTPSKALSDRRQRGASQRASEEVADDAVFYDAVDFLDSSDLEEEDSVYYPADKPNAAIEEELLSGPSQFSRLNLWHHFSSQGSSEKFFKGKYIRRPEDSADYDGRDTQVLLALSAVSLFLNRPTLRELIQFIHDVVTPLEGASAEQSEGEPSYAAAVNTAGLLGKRREAVLLHVQFSMETSQLILNQDDGLKLALISQDRVSFTLNVCPSSLEIHTEMGNLRVCDCSLGEGHHYGWVCESRASGHSRTNFVVVDFRSFDTTDPASQGLDYSVKAVFVQSHVIYLHRFATEVVEFFCGIAPAEAGRLVEMSHGAVVHYFTQSQVVGLPSVKLDIVFANSVFLVPRSSTDAQFIRLDLREVRAENAVEWLAGEEKDAMAVKLDRMHVKLVDLHLSLAEVGVPGEDIIQELRGLSITCVRPLRDLWSQQPLLDTQVKVATIRAAVSDKEYQSLAECFLGNIAEASAGAEAGDRPPADDITSSHSVAESSAPSVEMSEEPSEGGSLGAASVTFLLKVGSATLDAYIGKSRDVRLATLRMEDSELSFASWASETKTKLTVHVPLLDVKDAREGTRVELQSALSCAAPWAFSQEPGPSAAASHRHAGLFSATLHTSSSSSALWFRLQQPRLLFSPDFLMALSGFLSPPQESSDLKESNPEEEPTGLSRALFLTRSLSRQKEDTVVVLSPSSPLFVDCPEVHDYVYDGQDSYLRLCYSDGRNLAGPPPGPLIILGHCKRLKFVNVSIENGEFLDLCVSMGNGSSFCASQEDGVVILPSQLLLPSLGHPVPRSVGGPGVPKGLNTSTVVAEIVDAEAVCHDPTDWPADMLLYPETDLTARGSLFLSWRDSASQSSLEVEGRRVALHTSAGVAVVEPFESKLTVGFDRSRTTASVHVPHFRTNLTFRSIQVLVRLQEQFMAVYDSSSVKPTANCSQFTRIWTNVDGRHRLSVWRPHCPPGFVILGDCLTASAQAPTHTVLAVKLIPGRVKPPVGFRLVRSIQGRVGSEAGACIWEPQPPEGFVSLGFVASVGGQSAPAGAVHCVHKDLVTAASVRDCILAGVDGSPEEGLPAFWRVHNSVNSFVCGSRPELESRPVFDLRSQVIAGMTEAAGKQPGSPSAAPEGTPAGEAAFEDASVPKHTPATGFSRVWSSGTHSAGAAASIWRPVASWGFGPVGDVAVVGLEPPSSNADSLVVRMEFLAPPTGLRRVAWSQKAGSTPGLSVWLPLPPPGFVAMGSVANEGREPPPLRCVFCVRVDLVMRAGFADSSLWSSAGSGVRFSLWAVENKASTFFATTLKEASLKDPPKRLALELVDVKKPPANDTLRVSATAGHASFTISDDFGDLMSPICDLTLSALELGVSRGPEVVDARLTLSMAASSFTGQKSAWEPVVESWDAIVRYQQVTSASPWLHVQLSAASPLNVNLSVDNINHFLEAHSSWAGLARMEEDARRQISLGTEVRGSGRVRRVYLVQHNLLGHDVYVRAPDSKGQPGVFPLYAGGSASIRLPPRPPAADPSTNVTIQRTPNKFLALRVVEAQFGGALPGGGLGVGHGLACRVLLEEQSPSAPQGLHQRADTAFQAPSSPLPQACFQWDEVLLFEVSGVVSLRVSMEIVSAPSDTVVAVCSWPLHSGQLESAEDFGGREVGWQQQEIRTVPLWPPSSEPAGMEKVGAISVSQCVFSSAAPGSSGRVSSGGGMVEVAPERGGPWSKVGSIYVSGALAWRIAGEAVASEVMVVHGVKHVLLRSLVCVRNDSGVPLEVSVCAAAGPGSRARQALGSSSFLGSFSRSQQSAGSSLSWSDRRAVEVRVFENQRYSPVLGWRSPRRGRLFPLDPKRWSYEGFRLTRQEFVEPRLGEGWAWQGDWQVEQSQWVDAEGWAYGASFSDLAWPPGSSSSRAPLAGCVVRRRCWVRSKEFTPKEETTGRVWLGVLLPGERLPVPSGLLQMDAADMVPQFRPLDSEEAAQSVRDSGSSLLAGLRASYGLDAARPESSYEWSEAAHRGIHFPLDPRRQSLVLSRLAESEGIVRCSRRQRQSQRAQVGPGGRGESSVARQAAWFCVEVAASAVGVDSDFRPVQDWSIIVRPAVTLVNHLPVAGDFKVCEGDRAGGEESGTLSPDEAVGLTFLSPFKPLLLSWLPQSWPQAALGSEGSGLIHHPFREKASSLVLGDGLRSLRIQLRYDSGEKENQGCPSTVYLAVPLCVDYEGCPPLDIQMVDMSRSSKPSSVQDIARENFRNTMRALSAATKSKIAAEKARQGLFVGDRLVVETVAHHGEAHLALVGASEKEVPHLGLSIGLHGHACGPSVALANIADDAREVSFRLPDPSTGACYVLCATMEIAQARKLIRLRHRLTFTNRLGCAVMLQSPKAMLVQTRIPAAVEDMPVSFPGVEASKTFQFQMALEGTEMSFPLDFGKEKRECVLLRRASSSDRVAVLVDIRRRTESMFLLQVTLRWWGLSLPFRLENRSSTAEVLFRESGREDREWTVLSQRSSVPFAWEDSLGFRAIEVRGKHQPVDAARSYEIETEGLRDPLPVHSGPLTENHTCMPCQLAVCVVDNGVQKVVVFRDSLPQEASMQPSRLTWLRGAREQEPHEAAATQAEPPAIERGSPHPGVMGFLPPAVFCPLESRLAQHFRVLGQEEANDTGTRRSQPSTEYSLSLPHLGVSLIDTRPQELIYVSAEGVQLWHRSSRMKAIDKLKVILEGFQVDNQLPLAAFPVLLWQRAPPDSKDYVFKLKVERDRLGRDGELHFPAIHVWVAQSPVHVNIHEPVVWRLYSWYQSLNLSSQETDSASHMVVVDPEVRVDDVHISEISFKISMESSPLQRPKGTLGIWSILVDTAGNVSDTRVRLREITATLQSLQSNLASLLAGQFIRQLLQQPLGLLSGFDVMAVARAGLSASGKTVAELTHNKPFIATRSSTEAVRRASSFREGIIHGSEAFGRAVRYAAIAPVSRPANKFHRDRRLSAIAAELACGVADVGLLPLSGGLDFVSHSLEGMDAGLTLLARYLHVKAPVERRRLPRAMAGNRLLLPFDEDTAEAQAMLFSAQVGLLFGNAAILGITTKYASQDMYHCHFALPRDCLLVLTSLRVVLLRKWMHKQRCTVEWDVEWQNVLHVDAWLEGIPGATGSAVAVHARRARRASRCFLLASCSSAAQAEDVLKAVCEARQLFGAGHSPEQRPGDGSPRVPSVQRSLLSAPSSLPGLFALTPHFDSVWTSSRHLSVDCAVCSLSQAGAGSVDVTVWRPAAPQGYVSLGDIMLPASEMPGAVAVCRDESGPLAQSVGFHLVWRNVAGEDPLSIWMPIAPVNYVAMGCVVNDEYAEPDSVPCLRRDLVRCASGLSREPLWRRGISRHSPWPVAVYALNNSVQSFLAVRSAADMETVHVWDVGS